MKFPDFPDEKTLRMLKEYERLMNTTAHQKLIDELSKTPSATQKMIDQLTQTSQLNQVQIMEQSLRLAALEPRNEYKSLISKIAEDVLSSERDSLVRLAREVATAIRPTFYERIASEMANFARSPIYDFTQSGIAQLALDATKTMKEFQSNLSPNLLEVVQSLASFDDGPVRLAMETMRNLQLDIANPLFTKFIDKALSQPEPLTKKKIQTLGKEHLSKKRIGALPKKQQFDMMKLIAILSFFILIYSAWKMGQPITIDPDQIAKLNQPQVNITNVFQMMYPSEPMYYLVIRDCNLIPKPGKTRVVIYALSPGTKVKLLLTNHQWIYVHYEDGNTNKEGWVRKKYLKRLS